MYFGETTCSLGMSCTCPRDFGDSGCLLGGSVIETTGKMTGTRIRLIYVHEHFPRIRIRVLGQVLGYQYPRKHWCSQESFHLCS